MTNVNAYAVLMFIANIVLATPIVLSVIQQAKASMNIALVVSIVYLIISIGFFSENFALFFQKLGITISPVGYLIIAIFAFFISKDFGELRVRQGVRKAFLLSVIMVLLNVLDLFWVKTAALIPLLSFTWAFVLTAIICLRNWNIQ